MSIESAVSLDSTLDAALMQANLTMKAHFVESVAVAGSTGVAVVVVAEAVVVVVIGADVDKELVEPCQVKWERVELWTES